MVETSSNESSDQNSDNEMSLGKVGGGFNVE